MLSEILAPIFGCHQKLLLDDLRWRGSFGMKSELEVSDDLKSRALGPAMEYPKVQALSRHKTEEIN